MNFAGVTITKHGLVKLAYLVTLVCILFGIEHEVSEGLTATTRICDCQNLRNIGVKVVGDVSLSAIKNPVRSLAYCIGLHVVKV